MNYFKFYIPLFIFFVVFATGTVWAQIFKIRLGYDLHQLQVEKKLLLDEQMRHTAEVNRRRSPDSLRQQMKRYDLHLLPATGEHFVDFRTGSPLPVPGIPGNSY